jgi:hypothetical protein
LEASHIYRDLAIPTWTYLAIPHTWVLRDVADYIKRSYDPLLELVLVHLTDDQLDQPLKPDQYVWLRFKHPNLSQNPCFGQNDWNVTVEVRLVSSGDNSDPLDEAKVLTTLKIDES